MAKMTVTVFVHVRRKWFGRRYVVSINVPGPRGVLSDSFTVKGGIATATAIAIETGRRMADVVTAQIVDQGGDHG